VRELRNIIERAVIVAGEGELHLRHLPGAVAGSTPPAPAVARPSAPVVPATVAAEPAMLPDDVLQVKVGTRMADVEEAFVRLTLKHTNNNKRKSAQLLGLCLRTLHNKLRAWEGNHSRTAVAAASHIAPTE